MPTSQEVHEEIREEYDEWKYETSAKDLLDLVELFEESPNTGYTMEEIISEVDPENQTELVAVVVDLRQLKFLNQEGQDFVATDRLLSNGSKLQTDLKTIREKIESQ